MPPYAPLPYSLLPYPVMAGRLSGAHHTNCFASAYDNRRPPAKPPKYESLTTANGLLMRAANRNARGTGRTNTNGVTPSGNAIRLATNSGGAPT